MEKDRVSTLLTSLAQAGETVVSELKAKEVLRTWGLPVPDCRIADSHDTAVEAGEALGYPLALKVHSPRIIHKSDAGGVQLEIKNVGEMSKAYAEIERNCSSLDADFKVLVQPMAEKGLEVILGVTHDPQFGPVLMFGMGGILVEIFKDVSFRLIPLNKGDAVDMIHSIKALPLLKGYRGKPGVDLELLADMMVSVSELVAQNSVIREIDMNPIILYPKGAAVVDARMAVKIV
jgi:acetate---CoA ligase (ADP-forming) subunit beta